MIDPSHKVRGHKWTGAHVLLIYDRATHLGTDPKADRERIEKEVEAVMNDDQVWNVVRRIAKKLLERGAISGKMATNLF